MPTLKNFGNGFTLIELLVALTLSIMLLLTITSMFMTFLLSSSKTNINQKISEEGNFALNQMEFLLRNALSLTDNDVGQICEPNMAEIAFKSIDGLTTQLGVQSDGERNKIASSSTTQRMFLTSDAVSIVTGPTFDCTNSGNITVVGINFELTRTGLENSTPQVFSTTVNLRN